MVLNNKELTCSCHCGNIKYQIKLEKELASTETTKCNCSFCIKTRGWEIRVEKDNFKLVEGAPKLYQFGIKANEYYFCDSCGIQLYGLVSYDGGFYVVSVPTIDGLSEEDLEKLSSQIAYLDGKHDQWEVPPKYTKYL